MRGRILGYVCGCILWASLGVFAQGNSARVNDPMKKPAIWNKIKSDYKNVALWEQYMGVKWDVMNREQRKQMQDWQAAIEQEILTNAENSIGGVVNLDAVVVRANQEAEPLTQMDWHSESFWAMPVAFVSAQAQFERQLQEKEEQSKLQYQKGVQEIVETLPNEVDGLFSNIQGNFLLIEDWFFDEFTSFGGTYQYFDDAHPDGKYDVEKWVKENRAKLIELRKKSILVRQGN